MKVAENTIFTYAADDAGIYDATVPLTSECYDLLHSQIRRLVAHWNAVGASSQQDHPLVVDIGAGTGAEALYILRELRDAELICIDHSEHMLHILQQKTAQEFGYQTARNRCFCVRADVRERNWPGHALQAAGRANRPVNLAVSVYALHHLLPDEKIEVYRAIAELLQPRGTFIYGDLYSFQSPTLAAFAQGLEEKYISKSFSDRASAEPENAAKLKRLKATWLHHSQNENKPLPINRSSNASTSDFCVTEAELLMKAGFKVMEVPFRYFQSGGIWAET